MAVMLPLKSRYDFGIAPLNQAGSHVGDGIPAFVVPITFKGSVP